MTVKKTQQTLNATLEKTEQSLNGLATALENDVGGRSRAIGEQGEVDEKSGGLPEGWIATNLDNVIQKIVGGGTPRKINSSFFEGTIPWMTVKDMNKHVLEDTVDHISQEAVESSATNIIPAGIPIVATRMSLGKIVVANFDSAINQDLKALFPGEQINTDFLVYWYRSQGREVERLGTGTTVKGVRLEVLRALNFPLPPLAEQTVIAQTLDTLLAQVENIKTRLDAIPKILKTFRQSVLAAAVSGKLTEEWRGENECGEPVKSCLKNIGTLKGGKTPSKNNPLFWEEGSVPWVSPKDMKSEIIDGSKDLITELALKEGGMTLLPSNSILMVTRSGILAHSFPVALTSTPVTINQDIKAFGADSEKALPLFVAYAMRGNAHKILHTCSKKGTTVPSVETDMLMKFEFLLPSIQEQTEIVRRVEELFTFADQIEQQVENAQGRVNNLTQSILAKAFRGELTTQWRAENPDLISGDNSAEALLAKIQTERDALKKSSKPKKKSTAKKTTQKK